MGSLLPPNVIVPPVEPVPSVTVAHKHVTCEFCECVLTPNGDVLKMSERAREINRHAEEIRDLKEDLAASEAAGETYKRAMEKAERELAELRAPKSGSSFF